LAQSQKQENPSPSYPPGPAELLTASAFDGTTAKGTDGTYGESSLATESSPSAGGESQGPVHAAGHQDSPLRQQSPQPSQGPQCVAAASNNASGHGSGSRRTGRRGSGASAERSGRGSSSVVHSEERGGSQPVQEDRRISCSASGADGSVDGSVGPASPLDAKTSRPVYDDSIRQLLRPVAGVTPPFYPPFSPPVRPYGT
jgi:hypothetical protein